MDFQPYLGTFQIGTGPLTACIRALFSWLKIPCLCHTHPETWMQPSERSPEFIVHKNLLAASLPSR